MHSLIKFFLALMFLIVPFTVSAEQGRTVNVVIETDKGDITLELYPEKAPVTVDNFIQNVKAGLYEGGRFYRASRLDNNPTAKRKILTLIQGGKNEQKQERAPIAHETTIQSGLSHLDGVISMARLDPGTATTEFFICIGDNSGLDTGSTRYEEGKREGYAAFGRVIKGMDIVVAIQQRPTGSRAKDDDDWFGQQLINDTVVIERVVIQ